MEDNALFDALLETQVQVLMVAATDNELAHLRAICRSQAVKMMLLTIFLPPPYHKLGQAMRELAAAGLEYVDFKEE